MTRGLLLPQRNRQLAGAEGVIVGETAERPKYDELKVGIVQEILTKSQTSCATTRAWRGRIYAGSRDRKQRYLGASCSRNTLRTMLVLAVKICINQMPTQRSYRSVRKNKYVPKTWCAVYTTRDGACIVWSIAHQKLVVEGACWNVALARCRMSTIHAYWADFSNIQCCMQCSGGF